MKINDKRPIWKQILRGFCLVPVILVFGVFILGAVLGLVGVTITLLNGLSPEETKVFITLTGLTVLVVICFIGADRLSY